MRARPTLGDTALLSGTRALAGEVFEPDALAIRAQGGMGAPRARTRNRIVDHDAQALRRKRSGRSRHRRRCSTGIRRTEPQRIRAVTVGFDDNLYDTDDIRILTDQERGGQVQWSDEGPPDAACRPRTRSALRRRPAIGEVGRVGSPWLPGQVIFRSRRRI